MKNNAMGAAISVRYWPGEPAPAAAERVLGRGERDSAGAPSNGSGYLIPSDLRRPKLANDWAAPR